MSKIWLSNITVQVGTLDPQTLLQLPSTYFYSPERVFHQTYRTLLYWHVFIPQLHTDQNEYEASELPWQLSSVHLCLLISVLFQKLWGSSATWWGWSNGTMCEGKQVNPSLWWDQKSCYNLYQRSGAKSNTLHFIQRNSGTMALCMGFANHVTANYLCFLSVHESLLSSLHCCWFVCNSFFQIILCRLVNLLVSFCCYLISSC